MRPKKFFNEKSLKEVESISNETSISDYLPSNSFDDWTEQQKWDSNLKLVRKVKVNRLIELAISRRLGLLWIVAFSSQFEHRRQNGFSTRTVRMFNFPQLTYPGSIFQFYHSSFVLPVTKKDQNKFSNVIATDQPINVCSQKAHPTHQSS